MFAQAYSVTLLDLTEAVGRAQVLESTFLLEIQAA